MKSNMKRILNKLADIVDYMSAGAMMKSDTSRDFMRGYLTACVENAEITDEEMLTVLHFYDRLKDGKMFMADETTGGDAEDIK